MAKRKLWNIPSLRREGDEDIHRSVTWLELFFDLFFVVVIASVAHNLALNVTKAGLIEFVASFIPIWWVWIGYTYYNERFETEGLENRIFAFLLMIPVAGMASFSHHALTDNFNFFVGSYVIARIILTYMWGRATYHDLEFRPVGKIFTAGFLLSVSIAAVSLFVDGSLKHILFGLALTTELLMPSFTIKGSANLPKFSRTKLPERFGLFTIIVLGEVLVGVISSISSLDHPGVPIMISGALGIFIGFGFWWIYFDFVGRRPFHPSIGLQYAWGYLHMPLLMSFVALGAALMNVVGNDGHFGDGVRQLITFSFGFSLIFIAIIESILEMSEDEPTHQFFSPMLKAICGGISILIGLLITHIHTIPLLVVFCLLLLVVMFYGAYAWFTQELEEVEN